MSENPEENDRLRWPWFLVGVTALFTLAWSSAALCGYFTRPIGYFIGFWMVLAAVVAAYGSKWAFRRAGFTDQASLWLLAIGAALVGMLGFWYGCYQEERAVIAATPIQQVQDNKLKIRFVRNDKGDYVPTFDPPPPPVKSYGEYLERLEKEGMPVRGKYRTKIEKGLFRTVFRLEWLGIFALVLGTLVKPSTAADIGDQR